MGADRSLRLAIVKLEYWGTQRYNKVLAQRCSPLNYYGLCRAGGGHLLNAGGRLKKNPTKVTSFARLDKDTEILVQHGHTVLGRSREYTWVGPFAPSRDKCTGAM